MQILNKSKIRTLRDWFTVESSASNEISQHFLRKEYSLNIAFLLNDSSRCFYVFLVRKFEIIIIIGNYNNNLWEQLSQVFQKEN